MNYQQGILEPIPALGRYLLFQSRAGQDPDSCLDLLGRLVNGQSVVLGIGKPLLDRFQLSIDGMRNFPCREGSGLTVPATQVDLVCWLRGDDRGKIEHDSRRLFHCLESAFETVEIVEAFQFDGGRDLSGYEDGTENPQGEEAVKTAFLTDVTPGLAGSSFLALQKWRHNLDYFESLRESERDDIIGRRLRDNEEFDEAPDSAHVKRTAQESFSPEAFMLRRSMPWASDCERGLMFAAFADSFYPFEAQINRMVGLEDGISDGLFRFSRALSGSYFWCPPTSDDHLDLRLITGK